MSFHVFPDSNTMIALGISESVREIAEFLGVPHGKDAFTKVQDDTFMDSELQYYWGSISGNPNADPLSRYSTKIHNPAIRYFHMIIAHTFFGKPVNNKIVSKEELFIMFCVSQERPVNAATFLLANIVKIIQEPTSRISLGGFITFIARALNLHTPLSKIILSAGVQPMDIIFCFNNHLIGSLGPTEYLLLINFESIHQFTLPTPVLSAVSSTDPPNQINYGAAIAGVQDELATLRTDFTSLRDEVTTLRTDFHRFMELAIEQLDRCSNQIRRLQPALAKSPPSG
ncbi:hypothetical protein P8452_21814 [Trifolium repens]|nr:hypothetical protein P8452_21814 [Trifolium repens]